MEAYYGVVHLEGPQFPTLYCRNMTNSTVRPREVLCREAEFHVQRVRSRALCPAHESAYANVLVCIGIMSE
jgi:hypothetical protein